MSSGLKRTLVGWLMFVALRTVESFLRVLPWRTGRSVARLSGDLAYLLDRPQRKRNALANLMRAFPSLSRTEGKRTLRAVYGHVMESILDGLNFSRFAQHWDAADLLECVGFEKLDGLPRQTGVIFVTGHVGHWEVLGSASLLVGYPVWSMGRGLRHPLVDRYVRKLRESTGQRILPKRGALRSIIRLLRRGENVAFLIDQDARREGVFVDFFGRPASTTVSPARISIYTGAPIAFVYARRIGGQARFRVVLTDVVVPRRGNDARAEARRITQRLTRDLEEVVRQAPEQWLWLHRRWKTYPGKYGPA